MRSVFSSLVLASLVSAVLMADARPSPQATPGVCVLPASIGNTCSETRLCANGRCCSVGGWCGTETHCNAGCKSQCNKQADPRAFGAPACPAAPPLPANGIPEPVADSRNWTPSPHLSNGKFDRDSRGSYSSCGWPGMAALTYDDGPHPSYTPPLLDTLLRHNAKVTFYWVGQMIANNKAVAQRALKEGHHIASHSWSHPDLRELSAAQVRDELKRTDDAIKGIVGRRPKHFRPPYGALNQASHAVVQEFGYTVGLWNVDTEDWSAQVSGDAIVATYRSQLKSPGSRSYIMLQHDIQKKTRDSADAAINQIKANGFTIVPMYICVNQHAYQ